MNFVVSTDKKFQSYKSNENTLANSENQDSIKKEKKNPFSIKSILKVSLRSFLIFLLGLRDLIKFISLNLKYLKSKRSNKITAFREQIC